MLAAMTVNAFAATPDATLGLVELQAKLDASPTGSVHGYFKTVLKGSKIETIPVEVLSLTDEADPAKALILFQASGEKIAAYGGIASGMSGSPIYVDDEGVDKVVGAVSYGDYMTLGGTGLATPIEAMLRIQTDYGIRVSSLSSPVLVSGQLVDSVAVGSGSVRLASASGTLVGKPLAEVFIGGLKPRSALYAKVSSLLEKKGVHVAEISAPLSAGGTAFSTELVPGAAVGSLVSRGDVWVGGFGTVTYVDGDTVLAYGHPAYLLGATSMYMTNVWVTGVWPSSYFAYKMGYPTAVAGAFTQDRSAGLLGGIGAAPAEAPVFSHAVDTDSGREASDVTYLTSRLFDSGETSYLVYAAGSTAAAKLYDADHTAGSADVTTTVVVESAGETYTVVMTDMVDSSFDVVSTIADDSLGAVSSLLSVLDEGLEHPHIVSVEVDSRITTARRAARIVGVNSLAPLKSGSNKIRVSLLAYGVAATQTVDATLTLPRDAAFLGGILTAAASGDSGGGDEDLDAPVASSRVSVREIASELNRMAPNNSLIVTFEPGDDLLGGMTGGKPVSATITVPWVTSGDARAELSDITVETDPVVYGDMPYVYGLIDGPSDDVEVSIYGTPVGSTHESLLATTTAYYSDLEQGLVYEAFLPDVYQNTRLRVHMDGGDGYTPADATVLQQVAAYVRVTASRKTVWWPLPITLTARLEPGKTSGSVKFQYYSASKKAWRTIATKTLRRGTFESKASVRWTPPRGKTKVRVLYSGSATIAAAKSSSMTITRH